MWVSFSFNVVLRDHLFSLNLVSKPRMLLVRAVYVLSSLQIPGLSTFCTRTRIKIWRKVAFDSRLIWQAKAGIGKSPGWSKGQYRVQIGQAAHSSVEMFLAYRPSDRSRNAEGTTHFEHAYA
jgi:hypothetical protein